MRVHLLIADGDLAQDTLPHGAPPSIVRVVEAYPNQFDEPKNFIRKALRLINSSAAFERKRSASATKASQLLFAASLRAKAIGGWSTTRSYDPLDDFLQLRDTAAKRLGPVQAGNHPVTLFRLAIDETVRSLQEVTADQRMGGK